MESNDATFFEDIFPMKDMATSSNQGMASSSNLEPVTITESTTSMEHFEKLVEQKNEASLDSIIVPTFWSGTSDFTTRNL